MKTLLYLMCLTFCCNALAQNSYFVDKKGNKTVVSDNQLEIILIDKRISYVLPGKSWEKYITYKDLDYVSMGDYIFKTFKFDKKSRVHGYFVLAETADKKLLSTAVTISSNSSSSTHYSIVVIDNNSNIIEELGFHSGRGDDDKRALAAPLVRKHFPDCEDLISRLDDYDNGDEGVRDIMGFFDDPQNSNCN